MCQALPLQSLLRTMLAVPVAAVSLLMAAPAQAQDAVIPSWTGIYFGAGVGVGAINHELDVQVPIIASSVTFDGIGGEGVFGTVQIGADYQIHSHVVVGAFFDYDFSGIETDASLNVFGGALTASLEIPVKDMWTVGARIGVLSAPTTLWYLGAGYSRLRMDDLNVSVPGFGSISFGLPSFNGYSLLAGVESQLGHNFGLKLEYRFTQFDRESVFAIPGLVDVGLEPSLHTARLVASYRFGHASRTVEPLK